MKLLKKLGLFVLTGTMALGLGLMLNDAANEVKGAVTEQVIYTTGFEASDGFAASTSYNNASEKLQGPTGAQWGVIMGTASTTGPLVDSQSMQMRSYASNTTIGRAYPKSSFANLTKVTFEAKANASGGTMSVEYSLNNSTWSSMTVTGTYGTTQATITATIPAPYNGNQATVWFRINHTFINAANRMTIDSISVYGMVDESKTLDAIVITGTPTKTTYYAGENFDPTGITVTSYFSDSLFLDVTAVATYEPSPLTFGTTQIEVTFEDQTEYISGITVNDVPTMLVLDSDFTSSGNLAWTPTSFGAYFTDAYGTANKDAVSTLENENISLLSQSPLGTDIKVNVA
ncbi:hypothetical protein GX831_03560, partial [bacterium]|nr:hypothetical protein [bacterium]